MKTDDDDGDGGSAVRMTMMPQKDSDGRRMESPNTPRRSVMNGDEWEVSDFEQHGVGERRQAVRERRRMVVHERLRIVVVANGGPCREEANGRSVHRRVERWWHRENDSGVVANASGPRGVGRAYALYAVTIRRKNIMSRGECCWPR